MLQLLHWTVLVALFAASFGVAAWVGYVTRWYGLALVVWATGWLMVSRMPRPTRARHLTTLVAAVALMAIAALAMASIDARYATFVDWLKDVAGPVLAWLGIALPPTIAPIVVLLNGLALTAWLAAKLLLLRWTSSTEADWMDAVCAVAHHRREDSWRLKPWWVWARVIGPLLVVAGVMVLARQWWTLDDTGFAGWVWWIPCALVALGIEWSQWLSGEVDDRLDPELAGGENDPPVTEGMFEELWARYRRIWPDQWRIAGNRAPEFPDG